MEKAVKSVYGTQVYLNLDSYKMNLSTTQNRDLNVHFTAWQETCYVEAMSFKHLHYFQCILFEFLLETDFRMALEMANGGQNNVAHPPINKPPIGFSFGGASWSTGNSPVFVSVRPIDLAKAI